MISTLLPAGAQDTAAAQEVMDSIAEAGADGIDFAGFLHFFRMVRTFPNNACARAETLSPGTLRHGPHNALC